MIQYLGLAKYANFKPEDLSSEDLATILQVFGVHDSMSEEVRMAVLEVLHTGKIEVLSDLAGKPEVLEKVKDLVVYGGGPKPDPLFLCPHCQNFFKAD